MKTAQPLLTPVDPLPPPRRQRSWKWFEFASNVLEHSDDPEFYALLDELNNAIEHDQLDRARECNERLVAQHRLTLICISQLDWQQAYFVIAPASEVRRPAPDARPTPVRLSATAKAHEYKSALQKQAELAAGSFRVEHADSEADDS